MFEYILFSLVIFSWIILNANAEKLDNTRPIKNYELLQNADTMFINDKIDTVTFNLILKQDGLYLYQKYPNELIYKIDVPNVEFLVFLGDTLYFFNKESIEIKKIAPNNKTVIALEESYFLTISDGSIKIQDSNGHLVNKLN